MVHQQASWRPNTRRMAGFAVLSCVEAGAAVGRERIPWVELDVVACRANLYDEKGEGLV